MVQVPFNIELTDLAVDELKAIRVFDRRRIVDAIKHQLASEPQVAHRNCKRLESIAPAFEHAAPVWELRVGEYRVFYGARAAQSVVFVRAIRHKRPSQTTEEIVT
jgi:mRNA-degrading endonuclease RelE of RelBE toxin-antitoxin system